MNAVITLLIFLKQNKFTSPRHKEIIMKKALVNASIGIMIWTGAFHPAQAQNSTVRIDVTQTGEPISPYIYGQFIEHLGCCIYGGIWAEMLEDRKFFYPVTIE